MPGGTFVLKGLLDLNPATRLSVADVLRDGGGGLFETLRENVDEKESEKEESSCRQPIPGPMPELWMS
mgnify:CR=1 FL=1